MIPKIIHWCWFGGSPVPIDVQEYVDTWRRFCPDWKIIRWDESNFDVGQHPFVREAYKAKVWAFVSDYARLKVVYDNGGIYLDTDVETLRNNALKVNHHLQLFEVSATKGTGMDAWCDWLVKECAKCK